MDTTRLLISTSRHLGDHKSDSLKPDSFQDKEDSSLDDELYVSEEEEHLGGDKVLPVSSDVEFDEMEEESVVDESLQFLSTTESNDEEGNKVLKLLDEKVPEVVE
eukprot:CAMPEP_0202485776 /NCGR_PEP_ID=MMETSP1361-20130828/4521_1 /ASSEMBLY_ACC=CAM_ASM_000849 /TAXON_ID=210615 /ORGANISM="Staurosira complex sp., Strain CCMP2646" /LENGTH=104 /DNA_ID=CAMNT_0049114747 /DNA_START=175 /DNA_END=489 /DNA_ORIENTATION=+